MKYLLLLIYCFFLPLSLLSQLPDTNYDEALVPKYDLPDLFEFNNGKKVTNRNEWLLRKKEIIGHFENEVYGISPEWDGTIESFVISETDTLFDGLAKRQEILIRLKNNNKTVDIFLLLYLPRNICKAPIFLGYNFHGNHTVTFEEEIRITKNWVRNNNSADAVNNKASEKGRGAFSNRWPIKEIISRGFGVATLYYGDIDPDYDDGFKNGVHALYDAKGYNTSWGSIAAWSWGLSRVMDYLETKDDIDRDRIFLIGHSRLGKAALWAAACDERFAMVISNNSGCGGAALSRRQFGETVEIINNSFPHWFNGNFKNYNGKENLLSVDQHALIALMAPRPVYIASASEDLWADPKGEFLAGVHASPVYTLFDKDGIEGLSMPSVNSPIQQGSIAYHLRDGKHDITLYDWQEYMNYIDFHFCCFNSKNQDNKEIEDCHSIYYINKSDDFTVTGNGSSENWNKTEWLELSQRTALTDSNLKTKVKTLYSETGIYFLFHCEDNQLTATMETDFSDLWKEDVVEVFLWPDEKSPVYFEYEISPLNYELPLLVNNSGGELLRWQPFYYEANRQTRHKTFIVGDGKNSNRNIKGWMAEFFIPYKLLEPLNNVPPQKGDRWRANFYRLDYDQPITDRWEWQPIHKSFHEYEKFGTVIFK